MKYKMLCVDMDGTLLNNRKEITEPTKMALRKAEEAGVKVVIATGRLFTSANYYADLVGLRTPIISANGAFIREKDNNQVIYEALLGKENCYRILKIIKAYGIIPNFHTANTIFTERHNAHVKTYMKINEKHDIDNKIQIEFVDNWEEVFEKHHDSILKCIAIDEDLDKIQKAKAELAKCEGLETVSSSKNNFEVMCEGVSKGRAVEMLAAYYKIPREAVICVGDSENDMSMIQFAGLGVAMGNADKEIKEIAQFVTLSNEEDGVAKVIEKYIL